MSYWSKAVKFHSGVVHIPSNVLLARQLKKGRDLTVSIKRGLSLYFVMNRFYRHEVANPNSLESSKD